jgi:hypothetical protein
MRVSQLLSDGCKSWRQPTSTDVLNAREDPQPKIPRLMQATGQAWALREAGAEPLDGFRKPPSAKTITKITAAAPQIIDTTARTAA